MNKDNPLPPRMTRLGKAMRPVLQKLTTQIDMPVSRDSITANMTDLILRHMDALQVAANRLEKRIDDLMSEVVANETASDIDVYRTARRFEAVLDDLLADYQAIRALIVAGPDAKARDLLAGAYRHSLHEIRDWLGELVDVIADPMAAVMKRGLPTSGYVELPLTLTLTAAPEFDELERWPKDSPVTRRTPAKSELGFWGTVGIALIGLAIGDTLFGDHACRHD